MSESLPPEASNRWNRDDLAMWVALGVAVLFIGWIEVDRLLAVFQTDQPLVEWLAGFIVDTTPYLFWLATLPLFFKLRRHVMDPDSEGVKRFIRWVEEPHTPEEDSNTVKSDGQATRTWMLAAIVGIVSITASAYVSAQFGDLPPAYHDEFSYLFQAETFLRGRVVNDGFPEARELFNQMHVINLEPGRFASRYFPGVGLWMAPFVAIGHPYWGHWLAGAISAMFVFGVGRDLAGNGFGFLAGLLMAVSPGMALFSNHLLAHHPCLVGLTLFLFCFLRMMRSRTILYALLASSGLTFAMLSRPMTAAGFALPFGLWFLVDLFRGQKGNSKNATRQRLWLTGGLAVPLLVGFTILFAYNQAVTGSGTTTPYQQYTDNYSPRHVYGFHNRDRGEAWIAENRANGIELPVIENYDTWAENLTPALAAKNAYLRNIASSQWTLGIVLLLMAGLFLMIAPKQCSMESWMILAAILSLHVAHIPYWFSGILHFHYVFETIPLWLLVLALATHRFFNVVDRREWIWLKVWWLGGIAMTVLMLWTSFEPFWSSRLMAGIGEAKFARQKYALFDEQVERFVSERPAVLIIAQDQADRSIDYVYNSPGLDADVLRVRLLPETFPPQRVAELFPDRSVFLLDVRNQDPEQWKGYRIR